MVQSFVTDNGLVLIDPGTYVNVQVINNQSNIASAGVLTLIGEADEGPDFTQEADLNANSFSPDQLALVQQKYGSGRIVDAFRQAIVAALDPQITGAVSLVKIVKTNPSQKASRILSRPGFGEYASLEAVRAGFPGNLIKFRSEVSVPELAPETGEFAYVPSYAASGTVDFTLRANGLVAVANNVPVRQAGPAFATAATSIANGILVSGATEELPLTGNSGNAIAASVLSAPNSILLVTLTGQFDATQLPQVGDTVVVPKSGDYGTSHDSAILGAADANRGAYIVTAVSQGGSTSTITMRRVAAVTGAPSIAAASGTVDAALDDVIVFTPANIQNLTGMDRQATVGLSGSFTTVIASPLATITAPAPWAAQPVAGDTLKLSSTFAGLTAGFYEVLSSTANAVSLNRLSNGSAGTSGSQNVGSPITQGTQPFLVLKPTIDGLAKSLEIAGNIDAIAKDQNTFGPTGRSNSLIRSASEYVNQTTVSQNTNSASFTAGGDIVLLLGSSQANATAVVGASGIDFKVGSTIVFSTSFAQFAALSQLADYVNSQTTFSALVPLAKWNNVAPSSLDKGTFGLSATLTGAAGRPAGLKQDAAEWVASVGASTLAAPTNEQAAASGLPEVISPDQFLSGGIKAGTTSAQFVAAIDAAQGVQTNFLAALVSADASVDIASGQTEPTSTYAIDAVNSYLNSHCILMSSELSGQNRLAAGGKSGSYTSQKQAASALASFRFGLAFEDVKIVNSQGQLQQYQPWMTAVTALGMQAAAGYKGIVKKQANVAAVVKPEGDFNPARRGDRVDALKAGLLILEPIPTGGFRWVSDQMTYSADNNFVYNSMQAVYLSDLMALTLIEAFNQAVIGQSVAQISAAGGLSFLRGQMLNFLRLRWTAPSDDAPKGYKNESVVLSGGALQISVEAKLAGLIYFAPINFTISQVQQTANQ